MVMVVMHDLERRTLVANFLRERGYPFCLPPHRHDVLPMLRETHPDLLVLDLYVSYPNGIDVLKQLRANGYTGKVVAIAGLAMHSVMPDALGLGIDQVVGGPEGTLGPASLAQLEAALRTFGPDAADARERRPASDSFSPAGCEESAPMNRTMTNQA